MRITRLLLILALALAPTWAAAHEGPFDRMGCHAGDTDYHCHIGPMAGQSFAGAEDANDALRGRPFMPGPGGPPFGGKGQRPGGPGWSNGYVTAVQHLLHALGYNPGAVDGVPREETREAISRFQADRGLTITGMPSEPVLSELAKAARERIEGGPGPL